MISLISLWMPIDNPSKWGLQFVVPPWENEEFPFFRFSDIILILSWDFHLPYSLSSLFLRNGYIEENDSHTWYLDSCPSVLGQNDAQLLRLAKM